MARSMLQEKNLPNKLWVEGVATEVYIHNLSPSRIVQNKTPFEVWNGFKLCVNHLRIFGSICCALIPS